MTVQVATDMKAGRLDWLGRLALLALVLNGFAILTVNFWIYTARWDFIVRNPDYHKPPTISRAISDPAIGAPFSVWVTLSGIFLVVGVGILGLHFMRVVRLIEQPSRYQRLAGSVLIPAVFVLQGVSAVGMHLLSTYRFPESRDMHMIGSYTFFVAQALLVVLFTFYNHALLRDRAGLARLASLGVLSARWVRARFYTGLVSIGLVVLYFALFKAKDMYEYPEAPLLYLAYVTTEPMVISSFLLVLGLCHVDLHRVRRRG